MKANTRLTTLTRLGFATRGLLYIVIALLVLRAGRAEDPSGALEYLGRGGGRILLVVMAAGLIGYGVWRISDAALNIERHDSGVKGVAARLGAGISGLAHLALAYQAIRLLRGSRQTEDTVQTGTEAALQLPGGALLVLAAGAVLLGVGVYQLVRSAKGTFLRHLEPQIARQVWAQWSGRAGYAARGLVFLISGCFILSAGLSEQAGEARGTAAALSWLDSPIDVLVALGLFAFGLFSLIEARFRVLNDVPVDQIVDRATSG